MNIYKTRLSKKLIKNRILISHFTLSVSPLVSPLLFFFSKICLSLLLIDSAPPPLPLASVMLAKSIVQRKNIHGHVEQSHTDLSIILQFLVRFSFTNATAILLLQFRF